MAAICQETKLVIKKFKGSKQVYESYAVLKSDGKTKHGEYVSYFKAPGNVDKLIRKQTFKTDDYIKLRCVYKNGKKDGEWVEYSQPREFKIKGQYLNDQKVGIWLTSKEKGMVTERFDFDSKKKLPPIFYIYPRYPKSAIEAGLQGTVIASYQTHEDCSISNISITKSLSIDCDKAVVDALNGFGVLLKKYGVDCEAETLTKDFEFKLVD